MDGGTPLVDTVPPRYVGRLAGILNGDSDFLLAHLTVALVIEHNPGITMEDVIRLCSRIEPGISDLITEVVSSWER